MFKFPLQKVLEHRKNVENLAQKDLQEVIAHLNDEIAHLDHLLGQVQEAHSRVSMLTAQGGAQGPALSQIHEFLKGQKVFIAKQKQKVEEAEKLVEAKREILRHAALEYKIIEKMRENKFAEYRAERLATEQKEMDELAILRFKSSKES